MSPYEVAAREKKASAIARYLIPQIDFTRIDPAGALVSLSQAYRNECARRAGQNKPSQRTWARVVELVAVAV